MMEVVDFVEPYHRCSRCGIWIVESEFVIHFGICESCFSLSEDGVETTLNSGQGMWSTTSGAPVSTWGDPDAIKKAQESLTRSRGLTDGPMHACGCCGARGCRDRYCPCCGAPLPWRYAYPWERWKPFPVMPMTPLQPTDAYDHGLSERGGRAGAGSARGLTPRWSYETAARSFR